MPTSWSRARPTRRPARRQGRGRRAREGGGQVVMVHGTDPGVWFRTDYPEAGKHGTKPQQYEGLERMLAEVPDLVWIGAHRGGDAEHPDHHEELLERYPHLFLR